MPSTDGTPEVSSPPWKLCRRELVNAGAGMGKRHTACAHIGAVEALRFYRTEDGLAGDFVSADGKRAKSLSLPSEDVIVKCPGKRRGHWLPKLKPHMHSFVTSSRAPALDLAPYHQRWSQHPASGPCHSQDCLSIPFIICGCSTRQVRWSRASERQSFTNSRASSHPMFQQLQCH